MKTVSRVALYESLWTTPKRDVARSFGVTSDRLSRLCRRNQIPIPPQGFWNRSSEDRTARKIPLPNPEQDLEITIEPSAGHTPDGQRPEQLGIPIPDKVTRWHPLIRQTRSLLKECGEDKHGRYRPGAGCLDILVTKGCRQRAYRVMDTILRQCEEHGWTVLITEGNWPKTIVTVEGGEVAIGLEEILQRGSRKFTDEERRGHRYGMQLYPYFPSGRFALKTDWPSDENGRQTWREGKRFSLEYVLKQFIDGLEMAGIWKREYDERCARAAEKRRVREKERWEREQAEREESARVEELLVNTEFWAKSRTLRDYIQARIDDWKARDVDMSEDSEAGRWIAWASRQADRLDPLVSTAPPLFKKKRQQSFGEIMDSLGSKDES